MKKSKHKRALEARKEFSCKGSRCPICGKNFRNCSHSVVQAHDMLDRNIIDARLKDLGLLK